MDSAGDVLHMHPVAQSVRPDPTTRSKSCEELFKTIGTCRCLGDRETTPRTIDLESVFTGIKPYIRDAVEDLNRLIYGLQWHASETEDPGIEEIRAGVRNLSLIIRQGFESVALDIIFTPGYVCRAGRAEHEECFREREKLLSNLADNVTQAVQQAGPLFDSRVGLERTAARIRQRELALVAIRTASLVLIPFVPALAAAFSALDVLALGTYSVLQEFSFAPGHDSQVHDAIARIEAFENDLVERRAQVRALQDELAAIRRRVEAEQRQPASGRLVDVLEAVRCAVEAAKALHARATGEGETMGDESGEGSLGVLVEVVRRVGEAMEDESLVAGVAAMVSVEECVALDRSLDDLMTCV